MRVQQDRPLAGQLLDAERLVEVGLGPRERLGERVGLRTGRHGGVDVLGLAAVRGGAAPPCRGHEVGDLRSEVAADDVQGEVDRGGRARRGEDVAFVDVETDGSTSISGNWSLSCLAPVQWVVARRPSSRPASARANAPVQNVTRRAPGRAWARTAPA